ncbi:hypothetical protein [Shewanella vaxholmensis]|uniref:hypothetical protein n=1 Tax=Shewanella vaxholmensis TaxID=3063535 RepID=UPI00288CCB75|nr:hypothetical protein [Shewanella sp. SP1S1-4]MDT3306668.1 hypothetical protein [Shewanella sp. SP1S1-4]
MNLVILKKELKKWMQIDTWNSGHPLDEERFHKSLNRIFQSLGTSIDGYQFEEVMTELINELYPNWDESFKDELVNTYACKADSISSYLHDIK